MHHSPNKLNRQLKNWFNINGSLEHLQGAPYLLSLAKIESQFNKLPTPTTLYPFSYFEENLFTFLHLESHFLHSIFLKYYFINTFNFFK